MTFVSQPELVLDSHLLLNMMRFRNKFGMTFTKIITQPFYVVIGRLDNL